MDVIWWVIAGVAFKRVKPKVQELAEMRGGTVNLLAGILILTAELLIARRTLLFRLPIPGLRFLRR